MSVVFTPATVRGSQAGMKRDLRYVPALPQNLSAAGHSLRGGTKFVPAQARGLWVRNEHKYIPAGLEERMSDRHRFVPAWGVNKNNDPYEKVREEYSLDWWTDTALYNYDALLVSAFYGLDIWEFRDHYKIPHKDFLFVADSGGYQITTQKVKIEPLDILRWMEHNADLGFTVDVPPVYADSMKIYEDFEDFKRCAAASKRNYEIAHRHWDSENFELIKVIHGAEPKQLDYWYDLVEDLEFSGLAFSPKELNEKTIATILAYGYEKGAKKVHMFTGTGKGATPVVIYAKKFFDRLTYDSSTFSSQGAKMRSYFLPFHFQRRIKFGKAYTSTLKRLPCSCPVCQLATVDDFNASGSCPGGLIALHNLWTYLMYCDFIDALSDSKTDLLDLLKKQGQNETIKAIEFLDLVEDMGFYDAYDKVYAEEGEDASKLFV